ncbi:MAG: helix-turn-helix transcriptional regulator [Armatimonadetes bacterium]|nr:helix-turn-helix transcriptional regulator [Armatimonadota bacterium]
MNFPQRLRHARKEAGLSQVEMGQKIGVSGQSVKEWEAGRSCPQFDRLQAIAEVTAKPLAWFFLTGEESGPVVHNEVVRNSLEELDRVEAAVKRLKDRMVSMAGGELKRPWSEYRSWAEAMLARLAGEIRSCDFELLADELARSRWEFVQERSKDVRTPLLSDVG